MEELINSQQWFDIAKKYLDIGWSIIPVGKNKKPLCSWKSFQKERVTQEQLLRWCNNPALAGFAIVTGKLSGVFVLDIDQGSEFDLSSLPPTPHSRTGSGGHHFFFLLPSGEDMRNTGGFQPHTDTRGEGGYAILPPTVHPNGKTYEWVINPFSIPLAVIPDSLIAKLRKPVSGLKVSGTGENIFDGVGESMRNDSATKVIGKLLNRFKQEDWDNEAWPFAQAWNLKNKPPMEEQELLTTFNSIKRKALEDKSLEDEKTPQSNAAGKIVHLVQEKNLDIFLNQFSEPCITSPDCSFVAHLLKSKKAEQLLFKLFWDKYNKAPATKAVTEARHILEGIARFDNPVIKTLHNRIGQHGDTIYYEVGDNVHVYRISPNGWSAETTCPILFQRFNHQKVQVLAEKNGNLPDLLKLINISGEENRLLFLIVLAISFLPNIPRPVLVLHGPPGSAKSTSMKMERELIDPSNVPLLTSPKNAEELAQIASHNYVVFFDNLSVLSASLSDAICRLVTGDGYSKRELYTDDDDILYAHKRVVGFCGINQVATKADLLDRCVITPLEPIGAASRREEAELWSVFDELKPKLLGAVFDCLSYMLRIAPTLTITSRPRLADSYRYALAAAQFLGYSEDDLLRAYRLNAENQHDEALEASSTAQVVLKFMQDKDSWKGTSTELHGQLKPVADDLKVRFPKTPNWVWREVNEVRLNLSEAGIEVKKSKGTNANTIELTKTKNTSNDQAMAFLIEPEADGSMEAMEAEVPF